MRGKKNSGLWGWSLAALAARARPTGRRAPWRVSPAAFERLTKNRPPLPKPSRECFPVKSRKQLHWLLWQRHTRFLLYVGFRSRLPVSLMTSRRWSWFDRQPLSPIPLMITLRRGGYFIGDELSAWGGFFPARRFPGSFLARAIAEGRLYVCFNL